MEHRLDFLNPKWHYGYNVTVRLGDKWLCKTNPGDKVSIYRTGAVAPLASGVIIQAEIMRFGDVRIKDLWIEHDPECRTPDGLIKAMLRAYPEFDLDSHVTVLIFDIDTEEN